MSEGTEKIIERTAGIAYESVRACNATVGDYAASPWTCLPPKEKEKWTECVRLLFEQRHGRTAEIAHKHIRAWYERNDWTYGPMLNAAEKKTPIMAEYSDLSNHRQIRFGLIVGVVNAMWATWATAKTLEDSPESGNE